MVLNKDFIISALSIIVVIGLIGFASLHRQLEEHNVQDKAWDISLNNIKKIDSNSNSINEKVNGMLFTTDINFSSLKDKITYTIDIYNTGSINAKLNNLVVINNDFNYRVSGVIKGFLLTAGSINKLILEITPKNENAISHNQIFNLYIECIEAK